MSTYLIFIGAANLIGAFLLLACLKESWADLLLRRLCYFLPQEKPYVHSEYSRLFLWWAIIGTGFFGAINIVASGWPTEYATWIVYGNIYCYAAFELLAIAGSLSPRFGAGVHVAHVLWIGQAGWGVYTLL